jgi:pantetheine-phosphate adenylyltransferase
VWHFDEVGHLTRYSLGVMIDVKWMHVLTMTAEHTVLILPFTPSILADPSPILHLVYRTTQDSKASCTILFSTPSTPTGDIYSVLKAEPRKYWHTFQKFLGRVYATLSAAQWSVGRVLMDVEVGFEGYDLQQRFGGKKVKVINLRCECTREMGLMIAFLDLPIISKLNQVIGTHEAYTIPTADLNLGDMSTPIENSINPSRVNSGYPTTALGGTFDHLHAAHKLLLHLSLFLTTHKLIVGVMTPFLLKSKSNAQLLQSLDERIRTTKDFLSRQGTNVELDVVELHDPFGPTAWDGDIQALVVSKETVSGGEAVNKKRKEKGLGSLDVWVIDVIAAEPGIAQSGENNQRAVGGIKIRDLNHVDDEGELKDLKMGSTAIRQWIKDHPSV